MHIICFEDAEVAKLSPITTSRPAFTISCGGYRLIDWLYELAALTGGETNVDVRPFLRAVCESDHQVAPINGRNFRIDDESDVLVINARLAPTTLAREKLVELVDSKEARQWKDQSGRLIAVRFNAQHWVTVQKVMDEPGDFADQLQKAAGDMADEVTESVESELQLFQWPHDVVRVHMASIGAATEHRIRCGNYREIQDGVFVQENVRIGEHCVFDTSDGPVILDRDVSIGPMSFFAGPVYAAKGVRVIEHSSIKDAVAIGHTCKVGGEVEASILEPYTNKQHHGFLGHSYLGSWINLGAGTCNSDLKNTYGKINVTYGDQKVATNMQFFGCVVGDYSKTAINTSIFTGKVIGVCSMMYGFVTSNVPSYVNYARLFGQTSLLPADVMISTQQRMFARRKVPQRQCDRQLIIDMYEQTAGERSADADLL